jgi:hypothetical protein
MIDKPIEHNVVVSATNPGLDEEDWLVGGTPAGAGAGVVVVMGAAAATGGIAADGVEAMETDGVDDGCDGVGNRAGAVDIAAGEKEVGSGSNESGEDAVGDGTRVAGVGATAATAGRGVPGGKAGLVGCPAGVQPGVLGSDNVTFPDMVGGMSLAASDTIRPFTTTVRPFWIVPPPSQLPHTPTRRASAMTSAFVASSSRYPRV